MQLGNEKRESKNYLSYQNHQKESPGWSIVLKPKHQNEIWDRIKAL